jgi:putative transposase
MREIFRINPEVKTQLWGGEFWTYGYFVNTMSKFGDESTISKYVREQGVEKDYIILNKAKQLDLFSDTP